MDFGPEDSVTDLIGSLSGWGAVSTRVLRILTEQGIERAEQLTAKTEQDLRGFSGFGDGCVAEVRRVLAAHGMALKDDHRA